MFAQTRLQHAILIFIFFALIAISAMTELASNTYMPYIGDITNHLNAIYHAKYALAEGQILLRDLPNLGTEWRYPLYQFYSPTSYAFAGCIYRWLTPDNPFLAYKVTLWCLLVLGGTYMYRLSYWLLGSKHASLLAGVAYILAPYNILTIAQTGGFNESCGLSLIPVLVFYTFKRYFHPNKPQYLVVNAVCWYALATTHLITFTYTSLFLGLLMLIVTLRNKNHLRHLSSVGIAYLFALLLSMWFIAPIISIGKLLNLHSTFNNPDTFFSLRSNLLSLTSLVANHLTSGKGIFFDIMPNVGWTFLFGAGTTAYIYLQGLSYRSNRAQFWTPYFLVVFCFAFICVWSPLNFWRFVPNFLLVGQLPLRFSSQLMWPGALLFAGSIMYFWNGRVDIRHTLIGTLTIAVLSSTWLINTPNHYIAVDNFIQKPDFAFNNNVYTLDVAISAQYVDVIKNVLMPNIMMTNILHFGQTHKIPPALMALTTKPAAYYAAKIPETIPPNQILQAVVNNKIIASKALKAGDFEWTIPLTKSAQQTEFSFLLADKKNQKTLTLPAKFVTLTGFQSDTDILQPDAYIKKCRQSNGGTTCRIQVPDKVKMIKLPYFYYPNMLSVFVNGKAIQPFGLTQNGHVYTAFNTNSGQLDVVDFKMTGLVWANKVTYCSWIMLLILLLSSFPRPKKQFNRFQPKVCLNMRHKP
jgi:hypothetical protein